MACPHRLCAHTLRHEQNIISRSRFASSLSLSIRTRHTQEAAACPHRSPLTHSYFIFTSHTLPLLVPSDEKSRCSEEDRLFFLVLEHRLPCVGIDPKRLACVRIEHRAAWDRSDLHILLWRYDQRHHWRSNRRRGLVRSNRLAAVAELLARRSWLLCGGWCCPTRPGANRFYGNPRSGGCRAPALPAPAALGRRSHAASHEALDEARSEATGRPKLPGI